MNRGDFFVIFISTNFAKRHENRDVFQHSCRSLWLAMQRPNRAENMNLRDYFLCFEHLGFLLWILWIFFKINLNVLQWNTLHFKYFRYIKRSKMSRLISRFWVFVTRICFSPLLRHFKIVNKNLKIVKACSLAHVSLNGHNNSTRITTILYSTFMFPIAEWNNQYYFNFKFVQFQTWKSSCLYGYR